MQSSLNVAATESRAASFAPFAERMKAVGLAPIVIETFHAAYNHLREGATGYISDAVALPVDHLALDSSLGERERQAGIEALNRTVVCKLNGGLGTSMGLEGPKSLLPVKMG